MHIYASSTALTVEAQKTPGGAHTLGLDAAYKRGSEFVWQDKIAIQVTLKELPVVVSVLMGWTKECQYRFHGAERNKGFALLHQGGIILVTLEQKDRGSIRVPVTPPDAFEMGMMAVGQLAQNYPSMGIRDVMEICRLTTGRMLSIKSADKPLISQQQEP